MVRLQPSRISSSSSSPSSSSSSLPYSNKSKRRSIRDVCLRTITDDIRVNSTNRPVPTKQRSIRRFLADTDNDITKSNGNSTDDESTVLSFGSLLSDSTRSLQSVESFDRTMSTALPVLAGAVTTTTTATTSKPSFVRRHLFQSNQQHTMHIGTGIRQRRRMPSVPSTPSSSTGDTDGTDDTSDDSSSLSAVNVNVNVNATSSTIRSNSHSKFQSHLERFEAEMNRSLECMTITTSSRTPATAATIASRSNAAALMQVQEEKQQDNTTATASMRVQEEKQQVAITAAASVQMQEQKQQETATTAASVQVKEEKQPPRKKQVDFSTVEIKEYSVILGDNPNASYPLSLDWGHTEGWLLRIDDHKVICPGHVQDHGGRRLDKAMRLARLCAMGLTKKELHRMERDRKMSLLREWKDSQHYLDQDDDRVGSKVVLPPPRLVRTD